MIRSEIEHPGHSGHTARTFPMQRLFSHPSRAAPHLSLVINKAWEQHTRESHFIILTRDRQLHGKRALRRLDAACCVGKEPGGDDADELAGIQKMMRLT
jgi:hypothetical protein